MNTTLQTARGSIIREIHPEVRAIDGDEPLIDFTSSDETVDRYSEVISAAGWELDNYRRNPVVQNSHRYHDILDTLGRADVTEVRDGRLYQRIRFATEANPVARIAHGMYRGGFLRAVSVGFQPIEWQDMSPDEAAKAGGCRRRYTRQELLEVSCVSLPANPNALALAVKSGAVARRDFDALFDLLTTLRSTDEILARSAPSAGQCADGLVDALEKAHRVMCGR